MKIFKNKFILSTFILILSGMATKVFGMVIRIIFTRIVGAKTIGLYSVVMPTYSLILTISSMAMPTTIAKMIAQNKDTRVLNTATMLILILNFIIIFIMFLISPIIATKLLKNPDTYYLLIAMSLTLPFASLACILKGYFYGIQKNVPHAVSNLIEQIIRLILVILVIPHLIKISYVHAAAGFILTSVVTEFASIIVFLCYMKKSDVISLRKIKIYPQFLKNIFALSIPNVSSRIIGNICYFFEPIILTYTLLKNGYTSDYIMVNYGAYNVYAISTLTIPSFFITAISLALIPEISRFMHEKNYIFVKKRLKEAFVFSFVIGAGFTTFIYLFRYPILKMLYNTVLGANYIKYLSVFFIFFYFEAIFSSFLQSVDKTKVTFNITVFASIIKLICIFVFSFFNIGIYSLLIAEIINIIIVVLLNYIYVRYFFKKVLLT